MPLTDEPRASKASARELVANFRALLSPDRACSRRPQAFYLRSQVGPHYDALFGVWRVAWIAHQLRRDPAHLFDANIFYS